MDSKPTDSEPPVEPPPAEPQAPPQEIDEVVKLPSNFWSIVGVCTLVMFTFLSIAVSITIVCVTLSKQSNKKCELNFQRSAKYELDYEPRPRYISVSDFDKDGYLDIVVANSGTNNIGIFFGNTLGTFDDQITYSTGLQSHPVCVTTGNFNNDTLMDIVVANYRTNSIGVFLNVGKRNLTSPVTTSLGSSHPIALAVGDFNNDNYLDVAVVNYGTSTIALLLGFNNGSFQIRLIYNMGYDSIPYSISVADFNNDTMLDVAVVNYGTSNLVVLLANGNGSFISQTYSTQQNSNPSSVAIGDFNNDNRFDIAITNSGTSNVGIFLGYGNGSFTSMISYSTGLNSQPDFILINDFDNDTKYDVVVIDSKNNNVLVMKGNGRGNFSIITTHSTGYNSDPTSIVIGDYDHDNKLDIAISNNATNNIVILTQYDSFPTVTDVAYSTGDISYPFRAAVGDLNNDNFSDIIVANYLSSTIGIFMNLGNGTFADQIELFIGNTSNPNFIVVIDINNDKQLDIIVNDNGDYGIRILFGYGNGSFTASNLFVTANTTAPAYITVAYLNGDSILDIIMATIDNNNIGILFGIGNGEFRDVITLQVPANFLPVSVVVNDLNNDHILDIIASDSTSGGIAIFMGYGNESYGTPLILPTYDDLPNSLAIGDLNNDHRLDIVYASQSVSTVGILLGNRNGTFDNIITYSTGGGSYPQNVVLVDLNNDNQLDLAVVNIFDLSIGIFFGFGNGSFTSQTIFTTEGIDQPQSVAFTDFNNDLQLDFVVCKPTANEIAVYLVYFKSDFTYEISYLTGSAPHPSYVAIGDFNNDNRSDIVVANSGTDNIQVLFEYYQGTFLNKSAYSTGFSSSPQFVTVADFNNDQQADIAVTHTQDGIINIFLGYSNGTFDQPIIYPTGSESLPNSIGFGYFNHDNWTDIVVANSGANNIGAYLGFDYPTFTNDTIIIPGISSSPVYITAGDFNNDHYWDFVVVNVLTNNISVYLGYGNGTFAVPISYSAGSANSIAVGDFNGDKILDLVVATNSKDPIIIFIGFGNGSFQPQVSTDKSFSSAPVSVTVGELNNDSKLDIIVAYEGSSSIGVSLGYGNGSFRNQILIMLPTQSYPVWVVVNDLNNDNILDIVVANYGLNNVGILFGYGNGSFRDLITLSTGDNSGPISIVTGDMNNDKWIDIIVANVNSKTVGLFLGNGNGTFLSQITYSTGSQSQLMAISIADLNNDTLLDIIVVDAGSGNNNVGVFYGYGAGKFTVYNTYATGLNSYPCSIVICDFDNDARLDMAIIYSGEDSIGIMLQRKSKPFATPLLIPTGEDSRPMSVAVGYFNNDNHLDFTIANSGTNNIGIFLGDGNGEFSEQMTYSTGNNSTPISIAVGHFNNDTYLDIIVANEQTNTIMIFQGYGNGTITLLSIYSTGAGSAPSSLSIKDLNNDNYLDIAVTNFNSNEIVVFIGSNKGNFSKLNSYALGYNARPKSVTVGDINNDGLYDLIVANYGTNYVEILLQTC
ncbi:unnamed protein product [Adineta steineri]|uniref:Uncharacterized protein n=1 Tax=Adineta steineri TaxID=433720 RepID=A0A816DK64_9BILA|nr:unnamed protein product [Adineta steineri]CAF1635098.1 unnamed protein product [Adineta steineri]